MQAKSADGVLEDHARYVAFTIAFRLGTVLAGGSFLPTFDPASAAC